jgi:pimeloyl-ACP methyl ester carboxylesterase
MDDPDPRLWDELASIRMPTLIVAGGDESHIVQGQLREAAHRLACGTILTLDSGHHVHRARPGDFCDLVLGWLVAECN